MQELPAAESRSKESRSAERRGKVIKSHNIVTKGKHVEISVKSNSNILPTMSPVLLLLNTLMSISVGSLHTRWLTMESKGASEGQTIFFSPQI